MPIFDIIDRSSLIAVAIFVIVPRTNISTGIFEYFNVNLINSMAPNGDGWRNILADWLRQVAAVIYESSASSNDDGITKPDDINETL